MNGDEKTQLNSTEKLAARYRGAMGEMSSTELEVSGWYVRHRALLVRIGVWALGIVGVGFFVFSLVQWGIYLFSGYARDRALFLRQVRQAPNYAAIQPLYGARDLDIDRPDIFVSAPSRYDFVSDIANPNDRWAAVITYQYEHSRGETGLQEATLLPGTARPVAVLGEEVSAFPANVRLVILDTDWVNINAHAVPDVAAYANERVSFSVENISIERAGAESGSFAHRISFDLSNDTAYSYWQPFFYIELLDGNQRVGMLPLVLEQFKSGETRSVSVQSVASELRADTIAVYPIINIFDSREFMEPGA